MKKPADSAAAETAVRDAAANLKTAIENAREHGLSVAFPSNVEGLAGIAVSETGPARVVTTILVDPTLTDAPAEDVAVKAGEAAQKAATKVVDGAAKG